MKPDPSDLQLRNVRAWAAARPEMSGSATIVAAIDEVFRLRALVVMGEQVVQDFLPNIGVCALQDYGRLNTFLCQAAATRQAANT